MKEKYSSAYPNEKIPGELEANSGLMALDKAGEYWNRTFCNREIDITEKTIETVKELFKNKNVVSSEEIRKALKEVGEMVVGMETDLLRVGIIKLIGSGPPFLYRLRKD